MNRINLGCVSETRRYLDERVRAMRDRVGSSAGGERNVFFMIGCYLSYFHKIRVQSSFAWSGSHSKLPDRHINIF